VKRLLAACAAAVPLVLLAACASHTNGTPNGGPPAANGSTPAHPPVPAPPATVALVPASAATGVNPASAITATAAGGRLTTVSLVNTATKVVVKGRLSADGSVWTADQALGYGKHYRLSAGATNADGRSTSRTSEFTTLVPDAQAAAAIDTIYGNPIVDNATYGVGMIPVVSFDTPVADRAAAERALHVTTSPHVDGAWTWLDSTHAHWRPRNFYAPGTHVTIDAKVYGVRLGTGLYGASDESTSFVIGERHVSIADDSTHQVKVYFGNKLVRTMPTSMGKHSGEWVNGTWISFWTMDGTYTVIGHENPAIMSSASYGLPLGAPGSYAPEKIYWSTKISTDGIYLHELDSTVPSQGHEDKSHGCLNLNHDNAEWFFENSRVGDVVEAVHDGGPKITLQQGGDWSVPWTTWVNGSALH
jgi:lipoprotein-anchoring transpeptidase ErfK/SrfK